MKRSAISLTALLVGASLTTGCSAAPGEDASGGAETSALMTATHTAKHGHDVPGVFQSGAFTFHNASGPGTVSGFGIAGDVPVFGDWDGDGVETHGVVRGNVWYLTNHPGGTTAEISFVYGNAGMTPIVGDWDGDGKVTAGMVQGNTWYLRNTNTTGVADVTFVYGNVGDVPIVGDWDGNGTTTPGVQRGTTFYLRNSNSAGGGDIAAFTYGNPGDTPIAGDWDGDGVDTIGVVRPSGSSLAWYLRNSNTTGVSDVEATFGAPGQRVVVARPLPTNGVDLCDQIQNQKAGSVTNLPAFASVTLGSYDVGKNVFTWDKGIGVKSTQTCDIVDDPKPHKVCTTTTSHFLIPPAVDLQFLVTLTDNPSQNAKLTIGSLSGVGFAGASSMAVTGFFGGDLWIGIAGPTNSVGLDLNVERTEYEAAGCLTIPALPVGVVYQPPTTNGTSSMTLVNTVGARYTSMSSSSVSLSKPGTLSDMKTAGTALQGIGQGLTNLGIPNANILTTFMNWLGTSLIDQSTPGVQDSLTLVVDTAHNLDIESSVATTFYSESALGQGDGDVILYLPNVKVAYFNHDGEVTYVPVGHDGIGPVAVSAASLRPGAANPAALSDAQRAALLALDPIASGNVGAVSDATRFSPAGDFAMAQPIRETLTESTTITTSTIAQNIYQSNGADGSLIGLTFGAASGVSTGNTIATTLDVTGPVQFPMYVDRMFGTFAFGPGGE